MAEIPQGLSWVEREDDYALHRREGDRIITIGMSLEEALGLRQMLDQWDAAVKQRMQAQSGAVHTLTTFQAQTVSAETDAVRANLVVRWTTANGAESGISVVPEEAQDLAAEIESALRLLDQYRTRQ